MKTTVYFFEGLYYAKLESIKAIDGADQLCEQITVTKKEFQRILAEEGFEDVFVFGEEEEKRFVKQPKATQATQDQTEANSLPMPSDLAEVLKRLEALEQENKKLKERKNLNSAAQALQEIASKTHDLNIFQENLNDLNRIETKRNLMQSISLTFSASFFSETRTLINISNETIILFFVDMLRAKIEEKISELKFEIEEIENQF